MTKHIFIRHSKTDYNEQKLHDTLGKAKLNNEGKEQAKEIVEKLKALNLQKENTIIVISPLERTWETIRPSLQMFYSIEEIEKIYQEYKNIHQKYLELYTGNNFINYLLDEKAEHHFQI
ncbi:MAG: histidine phosphatase family protein [Candidatus Peribacteria bacterium]|nr:histidine phosphatase family protein [Candidatus Peribacteria bacterium]